MNEYSLTRLYELLRQDLIKWVTDNERLKNKITAHNLEYLFEFHKVRGLSIDLCRFEKDYYESVFSPPEDKSEMITDFIKKVVTVMRTTLKSLGKDEISLTIIIRNKVSEVSYWRTCYVGTNYDPKNISALQRKDKDWHK